jgi:hypothetical protein
MVDYLTHPLDSCFKRVERAHEHLLNLMAQADDTFRKQANSVVFEFDPNPPYKSITNLSPRRDLLRRYMAHWRGWPSCGSPALPESDGHWTHRRRDRWSLSVAQETVNLQV